MKYIPIKFHNLYYLYECLSKAFYPCTADIYQLFMTDFDALENIGEGEKRFLDILRERNQIQSKQLYTYPLFNRHDILKSLANVPHITLEITEKCNLNCVYCCYGDLYKKVQHGNQGNKVKILSYLNTLLKLRIEYNIYTDLRISFYGGEPLLRFDIIKECVELSKSLLPNVSIKFAMTTNGLLLDKYMSFLIKNDFDICISLDGNQKNDSYRIDKRKNETFYEVIKNIDTIYNSYPHFFKNNISFSTVIHNRNSIIEAGIFFDKYQKVPLFSFLSTSGLKKKNLKDFQKINCSKKYTYEEINIFRKEYPQLYNLFYKKSKDSIYEWGSYNNLKDMNDIFNKDKYIYPGGSCLLFQNKAFITINGDLLLCEKSFRKFKFGKISASKIVVYTQRVNKYYTQITHIFSKKCSGCYKFFSCSECYFSSEEAIINKQCFCHKEQARKEMQEIVNSIEE